MAAKFNFSFALFDPTFSDCTLRLQLTGTPPRRPVEKAEPSCDEVPGASQDALRACAAGQEDLEPCQGDGRGHSRHGDQDCPPVDAAACVQERSQARSSVTDVQAHRASREGRSREGSEVPVAGSELTEHRGTGQPAPEDPSLAPVLQPSGIESPEIWKENCERWDSGTDQEATARVPPRTPPTGEFSQAGAESHKEEDFVIVQDVEAGSSSSVGELPIDEPGVTEGGSQEDAAGNGTQESAWQSPNGRLDAPASAEAPAQQMCEELGKPNETGSTRDIPVSSVILAAKSTFFRELFATAAAQPVVLLEMPYSDEPFFLELLSFCYTGTLSCTLRLSYANILALLVVAHRFGAEECVEHCVDSLGPFIESLTPDQASMLVDLPGAVQERALLWPILRSAKATILQHYTPLLKTPLAQSVLDMSEGTLLALLQSGELDVGSEDVVARAALAWVRNRFPTRRGRQEAIRTLVVPNIRLSSLSPRFIESLQRLKEFYPRDLQQQLFDALVQAATSAAEPQGHPAESAPPQPPEGRDGPEAGANAGPSVTRRKQKLVLQEAPVANKPGRSRGSGGEKCQSMPPIGSNPGEAVTKENLPSGFHRFGYMPPSGTLFLGLVINRAALWTPGSGFCLLSSTSIVLGRRLIFGAKVEKHSRRAALGLYLLGVVGPTESFSCRFKLSCRPVGYTGDFWPLCAQAIPADFSARSPQWGLKDALGKPWGRFLREARESRVQEFEFRADIWM